MITADTPRWTAGLGLANSVGFGLTTILPLWVNMLGKDVGASDFAIGVTAAAQLLCCGAANLLARWLLASARPLAMGRWALAVSLLASVAQAFSPLSLFIPAALLSGGATGVLLASTNRLAAGGEHVQKSYAIFQLIEVGLAGSLLLAGGFMLSRHGVRSVFLTYALTQGIALAILGRLAPRTIADKARAESLPPSRGAQGWLTLGAIALFFAGQSGINAHLLPIGHAAMLSGDTIASTMSVATFFGLAGAAVARLLGERWGLAPPVVLGGLCLAVDFLALDGHATPATFMVGTCFIPAATFFVLPYFFTALARLDTQGSYAAIAPAFILVGVAIGPVMAALTTQGGRSGELGWATAALVMVGSGLFVPLFAGPSRQQASPAPARP